MKRLTMRALGILRRSFFRVLIPSSLVIAPQLAQGQGCTFTFIEDLKFGDKIQVTATLHSSDPSENGEGEVLLLSSSGGEFTGTVSVFGIPQTFSYKVAAFGPQTIKGIVLNGDGDESCELDATVN